MARQQQLVCQQLENISMAPIKRNVNGWWFWQYERSPGEWIRLKHLRD